MNDFLKNKWIYGAIILLVVVLTIWMFALNLGEDEGTEIQVDQQTSSTEETASYNEDSNSDVAADASEGYFFVKEADGVVNVYWYSGDQKTLYQETSIAFSLLSQEDQELLKTGIQLKDEQELANFLENFDS